MVDTTPVRDLDDSKDGQSADSIDSLRVLFSELDQAGVNSPIPAVRQNLGVAAAHVLLAIRDLECSRKRVRVDSSCGCGAVTRVRSIVTIPRVSVRPFLHAPSSISEDNEPIPDWLVSVSPPARKDRQKTGAITKPDANTMELLRATLLSAAAHAPNERG
jgi:hypothetical protein